MDEIIKNKTLKIMKDKKLFKKKLSETKSKEDIETIWKESHKRLAKMLEEYKDLPEGVANHTDNFIFPAAAIYLSIKEKYPDEAYGIMKEVMAEKSGKTGAFLAKCTRIPGFRKFFLGMWDSVSHKMFGETCGFKNTFYPKEKGYFRMDILECPYNKYLTLVGCPELNILFCENDVHTYGNLPGLKFTRTKTIGAGYELCDFKMELVKKCQ